MEKVNYQSEIKFPDGFLWGTSTSAYQIEGGIVNDWSEWEKSDARSKKLKKKRKDPKDYICGQACDSYNRYKEDFDLAVSLNTNAIRIGIEWARIQPKKDVWDVEAINHYRDVLQEAKNRNLKTVVTLWHWTNPIWFTKEGGWVKKGAIEYYLKYVDLIIENLGGNIDFWVTLNEPMLFANYGYLLGYFPPNKHSFFKFKKVTNNLVKAHVLAYEKIHNYFPNAQVSITNLSNFFDITKKWFLLGPIFKKIVEYYGIKIFFKKINKYIDYIGIDYYQRISLTLLPPFIKRKKDKITDLKWEIYPEGIYYIIKNLSIFNKPMYILENGLADQEDKNRAQFIKDHLFYVHKAIQEGADVRGYFHWSLLDNFEWAEGWSPKFGLFSVDRVSFERAKRPSADFYAEICKNNKFISD